MRLPNAPLVEVLCELRWEVQTTGPAGLVTFGYDPGFKIFEATFDTLMKKAGYTSQEVMAFPGPPLVWAVTKRYRKADSSLFPLVQIGHGVLAVNFSTDYDWPTFKSTVLGIFKLLDAAYPKGTHFSLRPIRIELKYIDSFDSKLVGHISLLCFLRDNTNIEYKGFDFLESEKFSNEDRGIFKLTKGLSDADIGSLSFEIMNINSDAILLTSSVIKESAFDAGWTEDIISAADGWLDEAHAVTSPFFSSLVSSDLMKHFNKKSIQK